MKVTRLCAILICSVGLLCAQEARVIVGGDSMMPVPIPKYDELKQYLTLSDAQLQSLNDIQRKRGEAEQEIYRQIREKQNVLNELLRTGSNDALRIGQLTVEINNLRKQLPISGEPYRSQALGVLNQEQRSKLAALVTALQLQSPAYQAVSLNLIEPPQRPGIPRILPMPAAEPLLELLTNASDRE